MHEVISPNCLSVIHCVSESRAHAMRPRSIDERTKALSAPLDSQWIGEMQSAALLCAQISQWHLRRFHPLSPHSPSYAISLISPKIFAPRLNRICLRVSGGGRNLLHPTLYRDEVLKRHS